MKHLALSVKVRLITSDSDMQLLLDTAKAYTSACNLVSEWIFHSHSLIHHTVHDALYLKLQMISVSSLRWQNQYYVRLLPVTVPY